VDRLEQVACLLRSASSPEPAVARGPAWIQMGTYHSNPGIAESNRRGNSYTTLQDQRELNRVSILQRESGQKGISPIARGWAIPHGRGVPQIHP
jgi:hypothetical protein